MATNRIERVLRHDGIVAVLDMTGDASSAPTTAAPASAPVSAPTPAPAPAPAPTGLAAGPGGAAAPTFGGAPAPAPTPAPAPAPSGGPQIAWVGDDNWRPIVMEAVKLRQIAGEPSVRVEVGDHKVMVSGDDKHVIGVVFIKGHPVVKSVVRMVRQLLRQPNNPPQGL